ncbi:MAG: hypothetical protein IPM21_02735 [Acidobacteria bacterium]|nr:hypothetical protein [Acidobacteriota bacterium]
MTEKQFYEWQILGDGTEFSQAVQKLGRDLVWLIARDGNELIFKSSTLEDTLQGKIRAWSDPKRRQSKRLKDLADIARLVEAHPELWDSLTDELRHQIEMP